MFRKLGLSARVKSRTLGPLGQECFCFQRCHFPKFYECLALDKTPNECFQDTQCIKESKGYF